MQYMSYNWAWSSWFLAGVGDADFAKKLTDLYREGLSDKKIAERMQVDGIRLRWVVFCHNYAQTHMSH